MEAPIQGYAKVGIVHFMAYPVNKGDGPILESLRRIVSDPFFDAVEVSWINDPAVRKQARNLFEQSLITVAFGAQPILLGGKHDLNSDSEVKRREAVDAVKGAIEQAVELGAISVSVLSGKDPGVAQRAAAMAKLIESLKELGDCASARGLRLVLEIFDRVPFGKNCLIGPSADAAAVAAEVRKNCPSFGLMVDLSHLPLLDEKPEDSIRTIREYFVHAHIGNCVKRNPRHPAYGDEHPRFGTPDGENGVVELRRFLQVLLNVGYLRMVDRRILSFEVRPLPGEEIEAVITGSKRILGEAWSSL